MKIIIDYILEESTKASNKQGRLAKVSFLLSCLICRFFKKDLLPENVHKYFPETPDSVSDLASDVASPYASPLPSLFLALTSPN